MHNSISLSRCMFCDGCAYSVHGCDDCALHKNMLKYDVTLEKCFLKGIVCNSWYLVIEWIYVLSGAPYK